MKKVDLQKSVQKVNEAMGKAAELGKGMADNAAQGVHQIADKAQLERTKAQLKKYNPVFPAELAVAEYRYPKIVVITTEEERKGISVCEGAVGWKKHERATEEVLYLYEEFIAESKLEFLPQPTRDAVYYADPANPRCYIQLDSFFEMTQSAKLAELLEIARSLGAKRYCAEVSGSEEFREKIKNKGKVQMGRRGGMETSDETSAEGKRVREGRAMVELDSGKDPVYPALFWFANDKSIKSMILARCSGENVMNNFEFLLKGTDSAVMDKTTATKIDATVKRLGLKSGVSMENKVIEERSSKIYFRVEFK